MDNFSPLKLKLQKIYLNSSNVVLFYSTLFSVIGVIASLHWLWSAVTSGSSVMTHDPTKECRIGDEESCPWFMVFTEMKDKIKNLEKSYEEQVSHRETLERDFMNQSELNYILTEKLKLFFKKLDNITLYCSRAESQAADIYARLYFDGVL